VHCTSRDKSALIGSRAGRLEAIAEAQRRSQPQRSRWSEGRGPRGTRTSKARTGHRAGSACHKRWSAYGKVRRHTPKAGAVCGNSACTDLGGGRSVMTVPTALQCEFFAS
jgi:hypothetical protein